jgi:ADP-ribose pyrophosphatase
MSGDSDADGANQGFRVHVSNERVVLPNGVTLWLDIVRHPGAAAIVPFIGDEEVLLIRQYRHAAAGTLLEVPAGKIDPGETPRTCAGRELEEEAGYRAGRLVDLGWIWTTPGFTDEKIHLFAAFDLTPSKQRPEDDEVIEVVRMPLAEAVELVWSGVLNDAKSSLALLRAARHLGRLR